MASLCICVVRFRAADPGEVATGMVAYWGYLYNVSMETGCWWLTPTILTALSGERLGGSWFEACPRAS
jgi:hypothetical protein